MVFFRNIAISFSEKPGKRFGEKYYIYLYNSYLQAALVREEKTNPKVA